MDASMHPSHPSSPQSLRRAAWGGAGKLFLAQLLLLSVAAVFFPLFAHAEPGDRKGALYRYVAAGIQRSHFANDRWPKSVVEIEAWTKNRPPQSTLAIALEWSNPYESQYAITIDGKTRRYRVPSVTLPRSTFVPERK